MYGRLLILSRSSGGLPSCRCVSAVSKTTWSTAQISDTTGRRSVTLESEHSINSTSGAAGSSRVRLQLWHTSSTNTWSPEKLNEFRVVCQGGSRTFQDGNSCGTFSGLLRTFSASSVLKPRLFKTSHNLTPDTASPSGKRETRRRYSTAVVSWWSAHSGIESKQQFAMVLSLWPRSLPN